MAQARSARVINQREKNVTYNTDRESEVCKIFLISQRLIRRTVKYGPQNWPITARVLTERYNNELYSIPIPTQNFNFKIKPKLNPLNLRWKSKFSFVTLTHFLYWRSREKLLKYQDQPNSSCVILSLILGTTLFYKALILQGEIWCWSLLG